MNPQELSFFNQKNQSSKTPEQSKGRHGSHVKTQGTQRELQSPTVNLQASSSILAVRERGMGPISTQILHSYVYVGVSTYEGKASQFTTWKSISSLLSCFSCYEFSMTLPTINGLTLSFAVCMSLRSNMETSSPINPATAYTAQPLPGQEMTCVDVHFSFSNFEMGSHQVA